MIKTVTIAVFFLTACGSEKDFYVDGGLLLPAARIPQKLVSAFTF
jgi:hypothetical protein